MHGYCRSQVLLSQLELARRKAEQRFCVSCLSPDWQGKAAAEQQDRNR
jgi:hypothetical protein